MKTQLLLSTITVLALGACTFIPEPSAVNTHIITIKAIQEDNSAMSRTIAPAGGTTVYWEAREEIMVFNNGVGSKFISNNVDITETTQFTGSLTAVIDFNQGFSTDNPLWGLYPYRADATSDKSSVTTTLPAEQVGRAGSFARNTHIAVGQSSNFLMRFYAVCGGIRFSLTQTGINRITFRGKQNEQLAGKITICFEGGIPVVQRVENAKAILTITAPNGGSFEVGKWYYIEALPVTLTNGFDMVFYKSGESAQFSSDAPASIKRGIYGSLANIDNGLAFKPDGSGIDPDPTGIVTFVDPIAKSACVEKYDENKDGEISYAEAAAVKSLDGLFDNWKTVSSFDELRFFTGVTSTEGVFDQLTQLKRVTIPDNITTLGWFMGCTALESVVLPSTLSTLPQACFFNCSSLSSIVLPRSLQMIPESCFYGCSSLANIVWPDSLTTIITHAFWGCPFADNNYTIELPSSVSFIGTEVFYGVHHIIIPSSDPATICSSSFSNHNVFFYVPSESIDKYKTSNNWCLYKGVIRPLTDYPCTLSVMPTLCEAIDLGLSVKWASCNVGADSPEIFGAFFSWGETDVKWDYDWSTYKYCRGNYSSMTKYNQNSRYGVVDYITVLDVVDDAATFNMGSGWRTPTLTELQELFSEDNCSCVVDTLNGVPGYRITSRIRGFEGRWIFLPITDHRGNVGYFDAGMEHLSTYWTSTLNTYYGNTACALSIIRNNFNENYFYLWNTYNSFYTQLSYRLLGGSVRAVHQ